MLDYKMLFFFKCLDQIYFLYVEFLNVLFLTSGDYMFLNVFKIYIVETLDNNVYNDQ